MLLMISHAFYFAFPLLIMSPAPICGMNLSSLASFFCIEASIKEKPVIILNFHSTVEHFHIVAYYIT